MGRCGFVNADRARVYLPAVSGNLPTVSRGDLRLLSLLLPRPLAGSPGPCRKSLSRLWPAQISSHSRFIFSSTTTTVQGGIVRDARHADRRLAWERLARSLLHCVCFSHRSSSDGPNRSLGSISRTTRYTCGRVIRDIFLPPSLLQAQQESSRHQA